ncbi:MAG: hypothetical protein ABEI52_02675, partial [Halobacteriaceae archaeon]
MSEIDYKKRLEETELRLHYCEFCGQIFPHADPFSNHRKASDVPGVDEIDTLTGFDGHTKVEPGEMVGEAVVGSEPC